MASLPAFAATQLSSNTPALLGSAETSLTSPTTTSTIVTAGSNGSVITSIIIAATGSTVLGLVYVFLYDGSTYHLFDIIPVSLITASTTVTPYRVKYDYKDLVIKSGWSLRCSQSIAGNASIIKVQALGGDF